MLKVKCRSVCSERSERMSSDSCSILDVFHYCTIRADSSGSYLAQGAYSIILDAVAMLTCQQPAV